MSVSEELATLQTDAVVFVEALARSAAALGKGPTDPGYEEGLTLFFSALDDFATKAYKAGALGERARIAEIMDMPAARLSQALAWGMAKTGEVSTEGARNAFDIAFQHAPALTGDGDEDTPLLN